MKSFKVGDWVQTWDIGLDMWKRGIVEAVRTENQDWCGTGTVRVLWVDNKRGYWVPEWRLKHVEEQPKQKQSKPKFKVGDRVELRGMSLWNGIEGVIKEIRDNEGVATVIFNDNCGYVIALENLKLLPKEEPEPKQSKPKQETEFKLPEFKIGDKIVVKGNGYCGGFVGEICKIRCGFITAKCEQSCSGYLYGYAHEFELAKPKEEPKPKQSKPKIAVGDLVEVQGIGRRNRGIVTVAGTSELTLRCGDGIHYGYVSTAVLIKTAAEVQKMFDDCPAPTPKQTTVFFAGDVVDRYDERGNFVARGIALGKDGYGYLKTLEKGEIVGPVLPEDLVLVAKRQDLRGLDSVLANMGQPSKPRKP